QGVDLLSEDGLDRVLDEQGRAWVRQQGREVGDDAQGPFEGADGEQSGVGNDAAALEIDKQLLPAEVPQVKVVGRLQNHELEPPQVNIRSSRSFWDVPLSAHHHACQMVFGPTDWLRTESMDGDGG